jgi:tetratricopeptide (TPR) repeat protein
MPAKSDTAANTVANPDPNPQNPFEKLAAAAQEYNAIYDQALAAAKAGKTQQALELLDKLLELQPGSLTVLLDKVRLLRAAGELDEALLTLEEVPDAFREDVAVLHERAQTLYEKNDLEGALKVIQVVLVRGDKAPHVRLLNALVLAKMGDREGTLMALEDAVDNGFLNYGRLTGEKPFAFVNAEPRFQALVERLHGIFDTAHKEALELMRREQEEEAAAAKKPRLRDLVRSYSGPDLLDELEGNLRRGKGQELKVDLVDLAEKPLRLADLARKLVVVVCWNTEEASSWKQLADLLTVREEFRGSPDLTFLLLAYPPDGGADASRSDLAAILKQRKIDIPCALIDMAFAQSLGLYGLPSALFVARDGKSYLNSPGYMDAATLRPLVRMLLEKEPRSAAGPTTSK